MKKSLKKSSKHNGFALISLISLQFDEKKIGEKIEKIFISVLIMGSAGVTVVYVLCVFIVCMRNEEGEENRDEIIPSDTQLTQRRLENSQEGQENEPLMLQFYAASN